MNCKYPSSALTAISCAVLLSACADGRYQPKVLDNNFGRAVKSVSYAQIADKEAAAHPQAQSPRKMDGYAGVNMLSGFREGFSQQGQQAPSVNINIGGGGSGSSSSNGQ